MSRYRWDDFGGERDAYDEGNRGRYASNPLAGGLIGLERAGERRTRGGR